MHANPSVAKVGGLLNRSCGARFRDLGPAPSSPFIGPRTDDVHPESTSDPPARYLAKAPREPLGAVFLDRGCPTADSR